MCRAWRTTTVFKALPLWRLYSAKTGSLEPEYAAAREWYSKLTTLQSLRNVGEVTYARSSGPGGQNVNKVNSKAQLRIPIDSLLPLIPVVLHQGVLSSRYYAEKSSTLIIQADESRKAQANKDACFRKLNELILDVYKHTVPGETTDEQKEKVKRLQKSEDEARLKRKKLQSSKKQSRSKGDMD
ncbi:uncharacterized protein Z520_01073 [Fonsecaea multimorphosa CBS 102226]|uniref:Prokaryotic-type class I peptide chain release factors domain-containing protein n=1 Tax=Fonsecaea multimorphosa CBS 102226 TaxID=1442371 RepID=A0A0D2K954_9EURO|nr:uncharacterized protein Z520_01073 [Fonsecaea multimorphosa CBS 102226]KIY02608.1 hypothetical protein Z520_01073 [Fonsecaea multimorphosa CBS 102226]